MSEGGAPTSPGLPPRYEVQKFLGQGAMGRVYLCRDAELDVLVAIKVLAPQYAEDPTSVEQVRTEARAVAKLRGCPTILSLYGFEQHQGTWYLVTEFAAGGALDQRLKRDGRLTEEECRRLGAEVAEALQYAHKSLVLHRDIKPGNVLLDEKGGVKVADFGIAKVLRADNAQVSTMTLTGTPMYMSPEAILREPMDARSDLYSLGCMLFEMATGKRPFSGSHFEIFLAKTGEGAVPPDPKPLAPHLSDAFCALVRKCMATKPDGRHPDGTALAAELRSLTRAQEEAHLATLTTRGKAGEGLPGFPQPPGAASHWEPDKSPGTPSADGATVRELPPSAPTRPQEATVREPAPAAAAAPPSTPAPAKKFPLVPVVAGVVALAAVGGWLAFGRGGDETPSEPPKKDGVDNATQPKPDTGPDDGAIKAPAPGPKPPAPEPEPVDGGRSESPPPAPAPAPAPSPSPPPGIEPVVKLEKAEGDLIKLPTALPEGFVLSGGRILCAKDRAEMVFVPAGPFQRGDDAGPPDGQPRGEVQLSAFLIDRHEVTVGQWREYCRLEQRALPAKLPDHDAKPIVGITHDQAKAYAAWAGKRLPTEAEWEKAARGPEGNLWPWGNDEDRAACNTEKRDGWDDREPFLVRVGTFPRDASVYGAIDMAGNASEWCSDWFDPDAYKANPPILDPRGPATSPAKNPADQRRCLRGGSWFTNPAYTVLHRRNSRAPAPGTPYLGFRCAADAAK